MNGKSHVEGSPSYEGKNLTPNPILCSEYPYLDSSYSMNKHEVLDTLRISNVDPMGNNTDNSEGSTMSDSSLPKIKLDSPPSKKPKAEVMGYLSDCYSVTILDAPNGEAMGVHLPMITAFSST